PPLLPYTTLFRSAVRSSRGPGTRASPAGGGGPALRAPPGPRGPRGAGGRRRGFPDVLRDLSGQGRLVRKAAGRLARETGAPRPRDRGRGAPRPRDGNRGASRPRADDCRRSL